MLQPVKDEVAQAKLAHRRTPTIEDFPLPAKQGFVLSGTNKRDQSLVSPSKSSFTFSDDEHTHAISTPQSIDQSPIARENGRATPADFSTSSSHEAPLRHELGRKRSNLSLLQFHEPHFSAREKVHRDSVILAEVKTNVIIRDEFLFLNDFSQHLSQRYQKPTSSIFITLDHSACLLFASSFDSAYILTITALPSQILSSANKRNAALIQSFMTSSLGVLPDRGIVKFVGLPDDYLGTAGTTMQGLTERLEKQNNEERKPPDMPLPQLPSNFHQSESRSQSFSHGHPQQSPPAQSLPQPQPQPPPRSPPRLQQPQPLHQRTHFQQSEPRRANTQKRKPPALSLLPKSRSMPGSRMPSPTPDASPAIPAIPIPKVSSMPDRNDKKVERMQKAGKRKSILALFGRG